jgi:ArsR family transcriptional regulator
MELKTATAALAALSQPTRLETFRLLVRHEPDGLPAGEIARQLEVPQNTMSAHLAILARAGLAASQRHSRSIIYRADLNRLRDLMLYLIKDCCDGNVGLCAPLIAELSASCCPAEGVRA